MDPRTCDLWIAEADNDLAMADVLRKKKKYNGAVFFYVQAAEKAVKGLLYLFNIQPWGHSLLNLLNECEKLGIVITPEFKTNAAAFENHYIESRYPDTSPGIPPSTAYDKEKTNEIRDQAKSIVDFAKQEKEVRVKP
jgi:HEPN domain-containing protein